MTPPYHGHHQPRDDLCQEACNNLRRLCGFSGLGGIDMLGDQGPVFRNLRAFVGFLQKQNLIARIEEPISTVLEVTELHRRVLARQGPALLLEQPIKSDGEMSRLPLLTNLFGTVERVSLGLGASEAALARRIFARLANCLHSCANPLRQPAFVTHCANGLWRAPH